MGTPLRAIEVTGTIDERHQLVFDEPLPLTGPSRVRVIILVEGEQAISEEEWLLAAAASPSFDFLRDQAEDIYSITDGKPFND